MARKPFFSLLPSVLLASLLLFLFHEERHLRQTLEAYQIELNQLREEVREAAADHDLLEKDRVLFKEAKRNGFIQTVSKKKISEALKVMRQTHPFVEAQVIRFEAGQASPQTKTQAYRLHLALKSPLDLLIFNFLRDLEKHPWGFKKTESLYVAREENVPSDPTSVGTHAELFLTLVFHGQKE